MDEPKGNVVEVKKFGNTTVRICDDSYRDKTPEDVERILKEISRKAYMFLCAEENKKT